MGKVVLDMSTSLDGIAGGSSEAEFWTVHEAVLGWVFNLRSWRREQGMEGGEDTLDSRVWGGSFARIGAQVIGRTMFDFGFEPWGENPPFHAPVFVHTHRAGERIEKLGGTSYTFVTDGIEAAIKQAKGAAGEKDVLVAGGIQVARAALAAGVVDQLQLHVAPVILGHGVRLFDEIGGSVKLRNIGTVAGGGAVHLTYEVIR
jgi:dihydrofolate reductase